MADVDPEVNYNSPVGDDSNEVSDYNDDERESYVSVMKNIDTNKNK